MSEKKKPGPGGLEQAREEASAADVAFSTERQIEAQGEHFARLASKWKPDLREVFEQLYARDHDGRQMLEEALFQVRAQ